MSDNKIVQPFSFVDKNQPIKPFTMVRKDPEERKYILLMYIESDGEAVNWFEEKIGRTTARDEIKMNIDTMDIHRSQVLVLNEEDTLSYISVYEFMKKMEEYFNDGFDIEDYNQGYSNIEGEE